MSYVWRNGVRVPGDTLPGTFPAGAQFFETFAYRQKTIECLEDHLARLTLGMKHQSLPLGPLVSGDRRAWRAALEGLAAADSILRLSTGSGIEELGARSIMPSPPTFFLRNLRTVRDAPEWLPRPKSAPWANSLAATIELRSLGVTAGTEGVQLDAQGNVSEGTRSSLAWVINGELCVPAESTGRLPGTALSQLIACCGLPVKSVAVPAPRQAEAVLLLRSTLPGGGVPVTEWQDVDGQAIWQAATIAPASNLLERLAAYRTQRSVSFA
jgi:branched-subunit amino acid aminotransferase/4-amino-4-deoxychorismate lyase